MTRALLVALVLLGSGCGERAGRGARSDPGAGPVDAASTLRVIDGDTLELDGQRHRLFGIDAPERGAVCDGADGRAWRCGEAATERLVALTGRSVPVCRDVPGQRDRYGRHISRCLVDGRDVAGQLVSEGLAWAFVRYSDDYVAAERAARAAGTGIWQAPNVPAWEWRAARSARAGADPGKAVGSRAAGTASMRTPEQAPKQLPPRPECDIKGNISPAGLIYHLPGSGAYAATRIATSRGERWFCSEREARDAGWRAPRR